jgi:putative membrane protein
MQLAIIAAIVAAIVGVFFAMQNNVPVTVNFLLWRFDSSLAMVVLLALALGAVVVALLTTPATLRWQWRLSRQRRQIEQLEKTAETQRQHIAELEKLVPADTEGAASSRPYVGLKELIVGRNDGHDDKA